MAAGHSTKRGPRNSMAAGHSIPRGPRNPGAPGHSAPRRPRNSVAPGHSAPRRPRNSVAPGHSAPRPSARQKRQRQIGTSAVKSRELDGSFASDDPPPPWRRWSSRFRSPIRPPSSRWRRCCWRSRTACRARSSAPGTPPSARRSAGSTLTTRNFYEYTIDEALCNGCDRCVMACRRARRSRLGPPRGASQLVPRPRPVPGGCQLPGDGDQGVEGLSRQAGAGVSPPRRAQQQAQEEAVGVGRHRRLAAEMTDHEDRSSSVGPLLQRPSEGRREQHLPEVPG